MPLGENLTPIVYEEQIPQKLTKWGLFLKLLKIFIHLGFEPIPVLQNEQSIYIPFDQMDEDSFIHRPNDTFGPYNVFFKFPDEATFTVDGVERRPILMMWAGNYSSSAANTIGQTLNFSIGSLPVDPDYHDFRFVTNADDLGACYFSMGHAQGFTTLGEGMGRVSNESYASVIGNAGGAVVGHTGDPTGSFWINQKFGTRMANRNQDRYLTVRNIQVVLSKAGLLVQVGSGTRKLDNNDYINFLVAFGPYRIPGRHRPPSADPDLDTASTATLFALGDTGIGGDEYFRDNVGNNYRLLGYSPGSQFEDPVLGTKLALNAVTGYVYPIDIVDRVQDIGIEWTKLKASRNSPRAIDGQGSHILVPMVWREFSDIENSNTLFGSSHPEVSITHPFHRWQEMWYFPYWVVSDNINPAGIHPDAASGRDYFFWRDNLTSDIYGIDVEGYGSKIGPLDVDSPALTLIDQTDYDMSSGAIAIAGGSVGSVPVSQVAKDADWTFTPATDEITRTGWTSQQENWDLEFDVSADPDGTLYEIVWEAYNRGATGTGYFDYAAYPDWNNPIIVQHQPDVTGATTYEDGFGGHLRCAGTLATAPEYNYSERRTWVARSEINNMLKLRFTCNFINGTGAKEFGIRNIRLRRYQANF